MPIEMIDDMSLRDYFAGQALAGICSISDTWPRDNDATEIARLSYAMAEAMLRQKLKLNG